MSVDSRPNRRPSHGIRSRVFAASALATALVLGCGGWAATAKLQGAIIAPGQIAVEQQVKQVQHPDGGVIKRILVANGQPVKQGDLLVQLDETQTRVELQIVQGQMNELVGRRARLAAERDGEAEISFPDGFEAAEATAKVAAGERRIFADNRSLRASQHEQLGLQSAQIEEQVRGLRTQLQANKAQVASIETELDGLRKLVKGKLVERTRVWAVERELSRIAGHTGSIEADIARSLGQMSEIKLKMIALEQTARAEAQREMRDIDARLAELVERQVAARDRLSRMEIRAPQDGVIGDLAVNTLGGVIGAGDTIMTIVPDDENLTVETRVSPADIDQVFVGQPTRLRFSAFNQRTTPELPGEVLMVAAAASRDPATGQSYYRADVRIAGDVRQLGDVKLVPGMPVEVFVSTGERLAVSYFLKPVTDQMTRAFKEE